MNVKRFFLSFVYLQNNPQLRGDGIFNRSNRALLRCCGIKRVPLLARAFSAPFRCRAPAQDTSADHLVPNRLSGKVSGRLYCGKSWSSEVCPLSPVDSPDLWSCLYSCRFHIPTMLRLPLSVVSIYYYATAHLTWFVTFIRIWGRSTK